MFKQLGAFERKRLPFASRRLASERISGTTTHTMEEEADPLLRQDQGGATAAAAATTVSYWAHVPLLQVVVCSLMTFIDGALDFGYYVYLPYLTMWLTSSEDASAAGWFSGMLATGRHVGHLVGAPMWGFLSDRVGSKPLLLAALAGVAATHVGFALSTAIWPAVAWRFLGGVADGGATLNMVRGESSLSPSSALPCAHPLV